MHSEAIKGFIWRKDSGDDNKGVFKYLVCFVMVSDEPISGLVSEDGDNIILSETQGLVDALSSVKKLKSEHKLGSIESAIKTVTRMQFPESETT